MKKQKAQLFNNKFITTDPEFVDIIKNFLQEDVLNAGNLSEKERMLCILSVLLGCQGMEEYCHMLHVALDSNIDPVAIKETVYQAAAYLGIGRISDYLLKTNEIMKEYGISLPLPAQSTTNRESRFERTCKTSRIIWFANG